MVIIFVLLVFVLAQAFLSVALSGRDKQLDRVNRQLAEVSDMLSLERGRGTDLQQSIAQLNRELAAASAARDTLSQQLAALQAQAERATPIATRCARSATSWRSSWPMPRCRHNRARRGRSSCSRISPRPPAAPMPRSRRPRRSPTQLAAADTRRTAAGRRAGAARRDAAADRRARQDGAGRTRTPSRRSCPISPSWPSRTARSPRCATSWRSRRRTRPRAR